MTPPWIETPILQRIADGGTPECFSLSRASAEQLAKRLLLAEAVIEIIRRTVVDPDNKLVDAMRAYDLNKAEATRGDHTNH